VNEKIKLSALKTARQIHKESVRSAWATLWYHYTGWLPNQVEILYLKWKVKHPGKWVPIEDAQPHDEGDQTSG
jgi:hypothetical protein